MPVSYPSPAAMFLNFSQLPTGKSTLELRNIYGRSSIVVLGVILAALD